jgi:hypothetical protein
MKRLGRMASVMVVMLLISTALVQAGEWKKLGMRIVKRRTERDVILVGEKEGTFKAIKLKVRKSGIHLLDMKVHFMNGDMFDVKIRRFIGRGGETRIIDLPGANRKIEKVVFWYKSLKKKDKEARIRLWGKQ